MFGEFSGRFGTGLGGSLGFPLAIPSRVLKGTTRVLSWRVSHSLRAPEGGVSASRTLQTYAFLVLVACFLGV